jgi:PhnB protein
MLTAADVKAAASFYQKAFGFINRGVTKGPDGKPMHTELALRSTTLMLGPENPDRAIRSAKTLGGSALTLYLTVENADKSWPKPSSLGRALSCQSWICFGATVAGL